MMKTNKTNYKIAFALTTILTFFASFGQARAQAQTQGSLSGEVVSYISQTPIYLEPSINAPIIASVSRNTKMNLVAYEINEKAIIGSPANTVFADNLYFKVKVDDKTEGYVPRYYLQTDATLSKVLATILGTDKKKQK
jgi:hypothetical protein